MSSTSTPFRIVIILCLMSDLDALATKSHLDYEDCKQLPPECTSGDRYFMCNIFHGPEDNIKIFRTLKLNGGLTPKVISLQHITLNDTEFEMYWNTQSFVLQVSTHIIYLKLSTHMHTCSLIGQRSIKLLILWLAWFSYL